MKRIVSLRSVYRFMEVKKTPRADLENERTTFLLLGFIVALSILFVVLEWQTKDVLELTEAELNRLFIEEEIELSGTEILLPLPAEPEITEPPTLPQPQAVLEDFNPVENTQDIPQPSEIDSAKEKPQENAIAEQVPKTQEQSKTNEEVVTDAEIKPEFPGGHSAMLRFIYTHLQYPQAAIKQRIQGKVICSFIINKDGSISDIRLEKGVYIFLDDEAIRVIKTMPSWKPGTTNGKPVRYRYYLPLLFRLR